MSRRGGRTPTCTPADARARLAHARKFLEAAELGRDRGTGQPGVGERRGVDAAKQLRRLLSVKDAAQYGFIHVSSSELRSVLRQAQALVDVGERSLLR